MESKYVDEKVTKVLTIFFGMVEASIALCRKSNG
jgi:hypothetical protein